jgi:hypothetical protein
MVAMTVHRRKANSFAAALPSPQELPVMKMVLASWLLMAFMSLSSSHCALRKRWTCPPLRPPLLEARFDDWRVSGIGLELIRSSGL